MIGKTTPTRRLLVGDSITFSWTELSARPEIVNRGVPGQTTAEMRDRIERLLEETDAGGVHILGGVNDIAGNGGAIPLGVTRANLEAMCRLASGRGLKVWLASVLPVAGIWWATAVQDASEQILELNQALKAGARAVGAAYVDYHSLLADVEGRLRPEFGTDGVHLSQAGYATITPLALSVLQPT